MTTTPPSLRSPAEALRRLRLLDLAAALPLVLLAAGPAAALDNDADDYSAGAVPAGTNLALLYYQHATRDKVRANGQTVSRGDLKSDIGILRLVRFVKFGPFLADPQVLLPFGRVEGSKALSGLGSADGLADAIVTATIWLVNKPEQGTFFGVTPAVYVPVGQYSRNRALNLGENRWKYMLQAGYVTRLGSPELSLQLSGDVTAFGDNEDYGTASQTLKQRPLLQLQAWLRYQVSPSVDLRLGTSHFTGGRTKVDGVSNDDRVRTTNMKVGVSWDFAPSWNLVALYGRDLSVHNGLQEANRLNLRLLKAF